MSSDEIKRFTADVDKLLEARARFISAVDDIGHVGGQNEWYTVSEIVS